MENKNRNRVEIPDGVVSPKDYILWQSYLKHPALTDTLITTSEGDELNIAMLPHYLRKKIEHLSPQEQEEIIAKKSRHLFYLNKMSLAKQRAYGRRKKNNAVVKRTPFEEDIIELLGRMFTVEEVIQIMHEDNGIEVTDKQVKKVLKENIINIEKKRDDFRSRVTDVRLYNKRPRLEELTWMFSRMKQRYIAINSIDAYNALLRTLEQIRKESEGDILNINGVLDVNIEMKLQAHIQKEVLRTVNLKEIIIGRVAARMGYDPNKLIAGLHNSYYAKFTEISGDYDPRAEMKYPSHSQYNFAEIERKAMEEGRDSNEVVDVTPEPLTEADEDTADSVRKMFLKKIKKQREFLEARQSNWDGRFEAAGKVPTTATSKQKPIKRGKGSGKDKLLPSKSKSKYSKVGAGQIDYMTGEPIEPKIKK